MHAALQCRRERAAQRGAGLHTAQPRVADLEADDLAAGGDAVELGLLGEVRALWLGLGLGLGLGYG